MKIKITDKKCGLEVGKVYDLCDMAAKNLISNRQAVEEVEKVEIKTEPKPGKGKSNGRNTKQIR